MNRSCLPAKQLAVFQLLSGAFSVSAAQSIFTNRLIAALPSHAPGASPAQVIAVGATNLRTVFKEKLVLMGILESYMKGLKASWAMGIGLAGVAVLLSFGPEMKNLKK